MKKLICLFLLIPLLPTLIKSQDTAGVDTTSSFILIEDDPVAAILDSLSLLTIFENNGVGKGQSIGAYSSSNIPYFPDSVVSERILAMNDQTPFEYIYNNQVKQFIELYAYKKRALTSRILGLAELYFPLFEEQLDLRNMPLELKYLAVIESALNPTANSRAGAKGLWQFMYGTGKVYGLKVTSLVDDRFDPYKSTIAACEHLQDLYDIYGNWSLALAAYNSGAGNVNKAIRRSGGHKNFWVIYPYLPRETRSYVPAFIAASYVMMYADAYKIGAVQPSILHYEIDTVTIHDILTLDQISEILSIPKDEIAFLNPAYKQGIIPASADNPYFLRLRKKDVGNFITNEANIYAYKTKLTQERDSLEKIVEESKRSTQYYIVKSGDNLGSIAKRYSMSVSQLKNMNNLRSNTIHPRQKLIVYNGSGPMPASSQPYASNTPEPTPSPSYHTVKKGESLGLIAGKYGCSVSQLMSWNNLSKSTIYAGQKLKVSGNGSSGSSSSKSSSSSSGGSKYTFYTIKSGDNLWDLAQKNNCTVSEIKTLNNIKNANRLRPGQKIKIPR
ncbi:MAG: LysM peptidoglycan-binding domain-containing protein [Bacteroidales bacterium]|nr:LysM peptidoglycan-binding domain-containing protein [Bacteroidales bacterium]